MLVVVNQISRYCRPGSSYFRTRVSATQHTFYSSASGDSKDACNQKTDGAEQGAMSRRLGQMTEESLESAGRSARKLVQEAVFDDNLRKQLEERIAESSAQQESLQPFSEVEKQPGPGHATRHVAGAKSNLTSEHLENTTSPTLPDAHRLLGGVRQAVTPRVAPIPRGRVSSGSRIANAKERSAVYSNARGNGMTEEEREVYLREIKARFQPNAREVPATLSGLASLANERIENAIARGQFKNLPRGKVLERDHNASSPWIDTTEYLMNKMIQKQDIVPPWIEKQQEVMTAARRFRARLRNDWKRHAARLIASKGGKLDEQMRRAEEYAAAEATKATPDEVDGTTSAASRNTDHLSAISPSGGLEPPRSTNPDNANATPAYAARKGVFRDPDWEAMERSFLKLAVENLNSMTRSYNLMAPQIAQRPYYNLERELNSCYADVAPLLRDEIQRRAMTPNVKINFLGSASAGALQRFETSKAKVYDEDIGKKGYGFRQFWRDLWGKDAE
jgi:hypothetical protein